MVGIHGAPGLTWGGVEAIPGNENIGYCNHVSILFPSWHRPYLALYEVCLKRLHTVFPQATFSHAELG